MNLSPPFHLHALRACLLAVALFAPYSPARAESVPTKDSAPAPSLSDRINRLSQTQPELPEGLLHSMRYNLEVSDRVDGRFTAQAKALRERVETWLERAEEGHDPLVEADGEIFMRGYDSPLVDPLQGYAVYLPENYNPNKRYPMMLALHGGSANGNLFLGVVLGNNMNWKEYNLHLWDTYTPRWKPDWIVVAPDGFGHVMWRFMGEQDVLDVMADVQKHYSVDPDRIVLCGLSNGGVGAYNIGMRHASRFSAVLAIAGAPSWVQYANARETPLEQRLLYPVSGMQLAENAQNTHLHYYHGHEDGGPMKPRYVEAFTKHISQLDVPYEETWYDAGHDLLYLVHRHGRIYDSLAPLRRQHQPSKVRLQTGDYRAARQHWLEATAIDNYPQVATVRGEVEAGEVRIEASGVSGLSLYPREMPLRGTESATIRINGKSVYQGPVAALGHRFHVRRAGEGFEPGFVDQAGRKRPGVSGPMTDAYFGPMLHVYGTQNPEHTEALKTIAERGARGWPLWLWNFRQPVVADTDVTETQLRSHHLVLYGTPGDNALLERIADQLPITIAADHVRLGKRKLTGKHVGAKFIYPSPLAPDRYVLVQAAPTVEGVARGNKLPDFLPDYVIHDAGSTGRRPRLLYGTSNAPLAQGFFSDTWELPFQGDGQGADDVPGETPTTPAPASKPPQGKQNAADSLEGESSSLPVPPHPGLPRRYATKPGTQEGQVARTIARRLAHFENFRARASHGSWFSDPVARWSIEPRSECLSDLAKQGIRVIQHPTLLNTPVATPVELASRIGGIWYRSTHEERPLLFSCDFVQKLKSVSFVLRKHDVRGVDVMSSYRETPRASMHTMGLAVDLLRFFRLNDTLSVLHDFQETEDRATCDGPAPRGAKARALRAIACALGRSRQFATVLTPNYNEGHRDHFHLDARPDDPRVFVR